MRFKQFIKTPIQKLYENIILEFGDELANLKGDLKSLLDKSKKLGSKIADNVKKIELLRKKKKSIDDSKQKEKIEDEVKKIEDENEKLREEKAKVSDQIEKEEQKSSDKKSDSQDSDESEKEEKPKQEKSKDIPGGPEKPELPEISDLPLKKMPDADIKKLVQYYDKMLKYLEFQRKNTEGKRTFNIAGRMSNIQDDKRDLETELNRRRK